MDNEIAQLVNNLEEGELTATRSGHIVRLYKYARHFHDTSHYQDDDRGSNGR